jgi:diacylglycerol kinase family enzyme
MTSPFGRLCLIARADDGASEGLPALRRSLDALGLDHELITVVEPGAGTRLAADALERGRTFFAVIGNDDAVDDVLDGLFADGAPPRDDLVLGVLPAGQDADLMRSFGIPDEVDRAARHLAGDATYPLDVMKVTAAGLEGERVTRHAANLAEVGMGAAAAARRGRSPHARTSRFRAFWSSYVRWAPTAVKVSADATRWEGTAFNVVIGNGQFSGGLRLSPRSFPGDGVLDALVFHGPRSDAYTMLPRIYRHGDHIPDAHVRELRAKIRVAVEADRPMPVVADGRYLGSTPVTFEVVPRRIRLKV